MKKLRVILMGVGNRDTVCAREMTKHPDHFELVGVAEPDEVRRKDFQTRFGLADARCFAAEEARRSDTVVDVDTYFRRYELENS